MNAILLLLVCGVGYWIAYHTYGKTLARRIFKLNDENPVPSVTLTDGEDFVPTQRGVIFGHHFTSIAGTGPIVGPAIGVIWGWVPAILWVFLGSIFMGAVHDFTALIISVRNQGKSLSEITATTISPRVRTMFFMIVFLALLIVIAIFGLVISVIFKLFPESVFPIWMEIPIAIGLGYWVYKKNGHLVFSTLASLGLMYVTVVLGHFFPIHLPTFLGIPPTGIWTIILLTYAFFASTLPVTTLLQPRDYLNAWQLYVALGLIVLGLLVTGFNQEVVMTAPAFQKTPAGAPPIWPFIFVTIACGAISGFHCLVCSGTTSKQLKKESDALFVGYGSMLVEALLATMIIIAVTAGVSLAYKTPDGSVLTGLGAWNAHYQSWTASAGLGSKLQAVVVGCSNFMASLGIPVELGIVIVGVFIASFAGTTLDSATRIQRYIVTELFSHTRFKPVINKWTATFFAVLTGAALAFSSGADGKGALALWPLFGAVNQLLAALALMVGTVYLAKRGGQAYWITLVPCLFMTVMTCWASGFNQIQFWQSQHWVLWGLNGIILLLSLAITLETIRVVWKTDYGF